MIDSQSLRIISKTGFGPIACKCIECQGQCVKAPCLGTPQDIERLIDAGYGDKIYGTIWAAGILMGVTDSVVSIYASEFTDTGCVFLKNGLCELHDKGLKPLEGRLSHHNRKVEPKKGVTWSIVKTWLDPVNQPVIERIKEKLNKSA